MPVAKSINDLKSKQRRNQKKKNTPKTSVVKDDGKSMDINDFF